MKPFLLCILISAASTHNIGLLLNRDDVFITSAIKDVADFTLSRLDNSTGLISREYNSSSYTSLLEAMSSLIKENVTAIISASTSSMAAIEADFASQHRIPFVAAVATDPYLKTADRDYMLLLSPSDKFQSHAIFDILKRFNWLEFSLLTSADSYGMNGVVHLQHLAIQDPNFRIINIQHFDVTKDIALFNITKELQRIKFSLARVIVLNCGEKYAKTIFREAKAEGLMKEGFVWIVTDSITGDAEAIAGNGSFPSYYRGLIGTVPDYGQDSERYDSFRDAYIDTDHGHGEHGGSCRNLMMSSIMVSDAITILHQSLAGLDKTEWNSNNPSVNGLSTKLDGEMILKAVTENSFNGTSGDITFGGNGVTRATSYNVVVFKRNSFHDIGNWNHINGLNINVKNLKIKYLGGTLKQPSGVGDTLAGVHLRVGIVSEDPIAYLNSSCRDDTTAPHCWEGWIPDIIEKLARDLKFTYTYVRAPLDKYGGFTVENKTWNGMIKDLLDDKTDLTIALSINYIRSQYIDFTSSFFESEASFVLRLPRPESYGRQLFFLLPFRIGIWATLFAWIAVIAFFVTLLSKLSPYGKPHEYMSFYNSLWTVSTGFVQQGGERVPRPLSGRFLLFIWWLFVMIIASMYTANLTAFLTNDMTQFDIHSLSQLLHQQEYKWGVITDRNIEAMMSQSNNKDYQGLVKEGINKHKQEGISKIQDGFVLIDEHSVLQHNFKNDCQAIIRKTNELSNEWALGLPKNSPYANVINRQFLEYREQGWFTKKWEEWYTSDRKCAGPVVGRFSLPIVSGLYGLLLFGIICSLLLLVLETLYATYVDCRRNGGAFWECFRKRVTGKRKQVRKEWLKRRAANNGDIGNSYVGIEGNSAEHQ